MLLHGRRETQLVERSRPEAVDQGPDVVQRASQISLHLGGDMQAVLVFGVDPSPQ